MWYVTLQFCICNSAQAYLITSKEHFSGWIFVFCGVLNYLLNNPLWGYIGRFKWSHFSFITMHIVDMSALHHDIQLTMLCWYLIAIVIIYSKYHINTIKKVEVNALLFSRITIIISKLFNFHFNWNECTDNLNWSIVFLMECLYDIIFALSNAMRMS